MTVCIVARTGGNLLFIADRMVTAGDIEFEPPTRKIQSLTSSIAMMFSGDSALHNELAQGLMLDIKTRLEADPNNWLNVKDVAHLYVKQWTAAKFRRAEIEVLAPLGLARETFLGQLGALDARMFQKITDQMANVRLPGVEAIIAGVDLRFGTPAPSIYQISDDFMMCADQVAFAAIGTGSRHAESQFMLAKYAGSVPNADALLLAYSAKRDAEVAPGVGTETDVLVVGNNVGQMFDLPVPLKEKLEAEYQKIKVLDQRARQKGRAEISKWLDNAASTPSPSQQPPASAGTAINTASTIDKS
jgi:hypothetical protein